MRINLLPCPICKSRPFIGQTEPGSGQGTVRNFTVFCNGLTPPHELSIELKGKRAAANFWNRLAGLLTQNEQKLRDAQA